jgi:colicin import membrane protein
MAKADQQKKEKESSVLISLRELMNLEEDRIREEEAEKEAKAKADLEAKLEAERAAREAEEARIRAEEEARHAEEVRRKEEAARVEAIKQGELERARSDAAHRARMEQMTAQQAHEYQVAALTQDKTKKKLQIIVGIAVGVLLIGGVAGGLAFKAHQEEAQKKAAILEAQRKDTEERLRRLQNEFELARRKEEELQGSLANAKDEATRAKLQAELDAQRAKTQAAGKAVKGGGPSDAPTKKKQCAPGDPLCD